MIHWKNQYKNITQQNTWNIRNIGWNGWKLEMEQKIKNGRLEGDEVAGEFL